MCTATYLPHPEGGFILTHSRDEKTARPSAEFPREYSRNGQAILYPKDPQGGGTWIATSGQTTVCLLNGGYKAHRAQPPYRHSRGLVPLHVFDYESINDFLTHYHPADLEPFTLLLAQIDRLVEVRWTGSRLFIHDKDTHRPHIWSSATLYGPEIVEQRERWFRQWLAYGGEPTAEAIRAFHLHAGEADPYNALRMNRNNTLMTLSLTSVVHTYGGVSLQYTDLVQSQTSFQLLQPYEYATA